MLLRGIFYFRIHLSFIWLILVFLEFFTVMLTFNLPNLMLDPFVGYLRKVFLKVSIPQRRIVICIVCFYMNCYFEKYHFLNYQICLMFRMQFIVVHVLPF